MKTKKILSIVLCLAMLLSMIPTVSFAEDVTLEQPTATDSYKSWYDGNSTATEFSVGTADEIAYLATLVNNGTESFAGKTVKLSADIDLAGIEWISIGTSSNPFLGTFDGDNKTISNLKGAANEIGLFGYTSQGNRFDNLAINEETIIKNLTLNNVFFNDNTYAQRGIGAVVGNGNMFTTLTNIKVMGKLYIRGWYAGGIMGYAYSGADISNCYVDGACEENNSEIRASVGGTGGIAGSIPCTDATFSITNCQVKNINNLETEYNWGAASIAGLVYNGKIENVLAENINVRAPEPPADYPELAMYDAYLAGGVALEGDNYALNVTLTVGGQPVAAEDGVICPVAGVGDDYYMSIEEAISNAPDGSTINVYKESAIENEITLTKSLTFEGAKVTTGSYDSDGNPVEWFMTIADGVSISGDNLSGAIAIASGAKVYVNAPDVALQANGDVTFMGDCVAYSFRASNSVVNIGTDATLTITKAKRLAMGGGNTFNITGSLSDAKTTDVSQIKPSLSTNYGVSFSTSADTTFNVTDAYVLLGYTDGTKTYTSSSKWSSAEFNFNITNSVLKTEGKLEFSKFEYDTAGVNFNCKDSVITQTTGSGYLKFSDSDSNVVFDNTDVNVDQRQYLENYGNMIIKNGSRVNATVAASSHGHQAGTLTVDNASLDASGDFTSPNGTGKLIVKNGGTVNATTLTNTAIEIDGISSLTANKILGTSTVKVDTTNLKAGTVLNIANAPADGVVSFEPPVGDNVDYKFENGKFEVLAINVAEVDGVKYTNFRDALKAVKSSTAEVPVVNILSDITISEKWDSRVYDGVYANGTFGQKPVVINGNNHTLRFTGNISDGNVEAVFRLNTDATFNDLTIDVSSVAKKVRAISSKDGDLIVNNCTFIGNYPAYGSRAINYGVGNNAKLPETDVKIIDSTFKNWTYGLMDNENGDADAKAIEVTGSEFENATLSVSAFESVNISNNEFDGSYVRVNSSSQPNDLVVTVLGNELEANGTTKNTSNYISAGATINAQEGFKTPVVEVVGGKKYISLGEAIAEIEEGKTTGNTIKLLTDVNDEHFVITKEINIVGNGLTRSNATLTNVTFEVKKGASFGLDNVNVRGLSYIWASTPESISVTNSDIDVTAVEVSGMGCPPAFIELKGEDKNAGVNLTFSRNNVKVAVDKTEDWYKVAHGIVGWNLIKSATITDNVFGSESDMLSAAAVKLMNFTDGAKATVSGNKFYVASEDADSLVALQMYQNGSRNNNYTATISENEFFVDGKTTAIGINVNGATSGAKANISGTNKVNGNKIVLDDINIFGNGLSQEATARNYVGIDVTFDANGNITGGEFKLESTELSNFVADGYQIARTASGIAVVSKKALAETIYVEFKDVTKEQADAEDEHIYEIVVKANDDDEIHELASADLTFIFEKTPLTDGEIDFVVNPAKGFTLTPQESAKDRYTFNYNGMKDEAGNEVYEGTGNAITIGTITVTGYGMYSISTDDNAETNIVNATTIMDNLVDSYTKGGTTDVNDTIGNLIVNVNSVEEDNLVGKITDAQIKVPVRKLEINLDFPNPVVNNAVAYQDMSVSIVGGNVEKVIALGDSDIDETTDETIINPAVVSVDGGYDISIDLPYNTSYVVTVKGAGYRTARYTVVLTENKVLDFWNNVMTAERVIEHGKGTSAVTKNFLAGDIVLDGEINIYDLSAVVSYFGNENIDRTQYSKFAKYDLNRDGKIDSKDVAYVLVSWGN